MALSIKDPETDELARELAERTGESLTEAVRKALQEVAGSPVVASEGPMRGRRGAAVEPAGPASILTAGLLEILPGARSRITVIQ